MSRTLSVPISTLRVWWLRLALSFYPPAREVSSDVANLTERKNPHAPVNGVKEFVCVSVTNFDPNFSGLAEQNGLKFFRTFLAK